MRTGLLCSLTLVILGCSDPLPPGEVANVIDMTAAIGDADLDLAGVAVDPDTGRRYVLDADRGIFELGADGVATPIVPMAQMPDPGVEVRLPFTDIAALGDDKLALTAIGDGFILDLASQTLSLHFCYEPGFVEPWPEEQEQRTDAVTFDPNAGQIIAQPRTFGVDTGDIMASQIGYYDRASGVDLQWYDVPVSFRSGGMAVLPGVGLVLSNRTDLYAFDGGLHDLDRLERFDVGSVDGLAYDPTAGSLLVIDGSRRQLVEIALGDLGL